MENKDVRDEGYYDETYMKKVIKYFSNRGLTVSEIAKLLGMEEKEILFLLNN